MNCFQLIKTVLDEAYAEIPGTVEERDAAINQAITDLSSAYKKLVTKGCLDYTDPSRRFAYIRAYTTCHANIVYNKVSKHNELRDLFDLQKLTISCIGGGPGSDFLGIMKYCLRAEKAVELKFQILDRDPAWGESWSDVDNKVNSTFRISTTHQPVDVADPESWRKFKKPFNADLFTLVYFVSEVYAVRRKSQAFFVELMAKMKPGALMLYVDNNDSRFTDWFDGLVEAAGLEVVKSGAGVETLPSHEEKSDLEPYYTKFKTDPKLRADVAYRILRKPAK
jgi:hypothetical protein